MQCVAVCCRVLHYAAMCCCEFAVRCSARQSRETLPLILSAAVCCSVLQCVAVRCSALQCVALCCIVLQCLAVWCSVLQCVAVRCSVLQCVAVYRTPSALLVDPPARVLILSFLPLSLFPLSSSLSPIPPPPFLSVFSLALPSPHPALHLSFSPLCALLSGVRPFGKVKYATRCNTLQHTATVNYAQVHPCVSHCNTLQHTATHCRSLQHTAKHCKTLQLI